MSAQHLEQVQLKALDQAGVDLKMKWNNKYKKKQYKTIKNFYKTKKIKN
jgi:hypothetical protein